MKNQIMDLHVLLMVSEFSSFKKILFLKRNLYFIAEWNSREERGRERDYDRKRDDNREGWTANQGMFFIHS